MKYVLTGGSGHITKPLAEKLLAAQHDVTVIGRSESNLAPLLEKGAKVAIGSVEDLAFLTETFKGANAVYTMVPPKYDAPDLKAHIARVGTNYTAAIRSNNIAHVVNLSSIGAHLPTGCGPVTGLHRVEKSLNDLTATNILHLRPGYFYYNILGSVELARKAGNIGSNFGGDSCKLIMSDPADIAEAAAEALLTLAFNGHTVKYIASDVRETGDIARVIGTAIGNPELPWIHFTDDQFKEGLLAAGLPEEIASNFTEMGGAINSGKMFEDFQDHRPTQYGKVKLEDFARVFAAAYKSQ